MNFSDHLYPSEDVQNLAITFSRHESGPYQGTAVSRSSFRSILPILRVQFEVSLHPKAKAGRPLVTTCDTDRSFCLGHSWSALPPATIITSTLLPAPFCPSHICIYTFVPPFHAGSWYLSRTQPFVELCTTTKQRLDQSRPLLLLEAPTVIQINRKMARKTLIVFIGFDLIFLLCAGLHLFIPLFTRANMKKEPSLESIANNLLLDECPLTASMVNAGIMIVAFLISVPAIFKRQNLILLQTQAWLIVGCAIFTLGIGLKIWFSTLETRNNFEPMWNRQGTFVQSILQFKFKCCGYRDGGPFIPDGTCPNAADAVRHGGCMGPFSAFANKFLDVVFTTFFGFVVVDVLVLLSVLCVLKERKEQIRYVLIDEKRRFGGI